MSRKKKHFLERYYELIKEVKSPPLFPELHLIERIQRVRNKTHQRYSEPNPIKFNFAANDNLLSTLRPDELLLIYCYEKLLAENESIKKKNRQVIFNLVSDEQIRLFIHKQQYAIETHVRELTSELNIKTESEIRNFSNPPERVDALKLILRSVKELIRNVEEEYCSFLKLEIAIPFKEHTLSTHFIKNKFEHLKAALLTSNIDAQLLKMISEPFLKLLSDNFKDKISYQHFQYCHRLLKEFIDFIDNNSVQISDERLLHLLYVHNFNKLSLFQYLTDNIESKFAGLETTSEKLLILKEQHKIFSQRQLLTPERFDPELPSINIQVLGWIDEEIHFQSQLVSAAQSYLSNSKESQPKEKLLTGISVAQLSYTFQLLNKVGIISERNQRDIFRFISDNFKTKITDQISVDSIKSKYYNVESSTKSAVREKMIEILNLTKS